MAKKKEIQQKLMNFCNDMKIDFDLEKIVDISERLKKQDENAYGILDKYLILEHNSVFLKSESIRNEQFNEVLYQPSVLSELISKTDMANMVSAMLNLNNSNSYNTDNYISEFGFSFDSDDMDFWEDNIECILDGIFNKYCNRNKIFDYIQSNNKKIFEVETVKVYICNFSEMNPRNN